MDGREERFEALFACVQPRHRRVLRLACASTGRRAGCGRRGVPDGVAAPRRAPRGRRRAGLALRDGAEGDREPAAVEPAPRRAAGTPRARGASARGAARPAEEAWCTRRFCTSGRATARCCCSPSGRASARPRSRPSWAVYGDGQRTTASREAPVPHGLRAARSAPRSATESAQRPTTSTRKEDHEHVTQPRRAASGEPAAGGRLRAGGRGRRRSRAGADRHDSPMPVGPGARRRLVRRPSPPRALVAAVGAAGAYDLRLRRGTEDEFAAARSGRPRG